MLEFDVYFANDVYFVNDSCKELGSRESNLWTRISPAAYLDAERGAWALLNIWLLIVSAELFRASGPKYLASADICWFLVDGDFFFDCGFSRRERGTLQDMASILRLSLHCQVVNKTFAFHRCLNRPLLPPEKTKVLPRQVAVCSCRQTECRLRRWKYFICKSYDKERLHTLTVDKP